MCPAYAKYYEHLALHSRHVCRAKARANVCKNMVHNVHFCLCLYVSVCVRTHVDDSMAAYIHERVCNDKTETRDALQLLVPSDEAESSSDRFYLPCLNLNLPGCGMSNSLRTNGISQTS